MGAKRIIPCMDVKDGRVVKGVQFVNFKDAGDPAEIAAYYCGAGADELVFLDISATVEGRDTMVDVVRKTALHVSIPFTVGGGIKSVEEMEKIFSAGAHKVSINSAAVKNPALIGEAVEKFGSSKIVVAIDVKKRDNAAGYDVLVNGGAVNTGIDAVEWAMEVEKRGAGEILLTSLDCDGAKDGYDLEITRAVAEAVNIPVVASGGAGQLSHFYDALTEGKADAALAASLFHFRELEIRQVKEYLRGRGVAVRLQGDA